MGILDSDFFKWASDSRGFYEEKRREKKGQQLIGLLDRYGVGQDLAGPLQPGQARDVGQLPGSQSRFYGEAAALYPQAGLLGNAQSQAGSMERQMQAQGVISAAQQAQLEQQRAQMAQQQAQWAGVSGNQAASLAQQQSQFGQISPYQQAQLDQQRASAGRGLLGTPPSGQMWGLGDNGQPVLVDVQGGPQQQKQAERLSKIESAYKSANAYADRIERFGATELGAESVQFDRQHRDNIMAGLQQLNEMGVLNEGEYQRYLEDLPSQSDWLSMKTIGDWSGKSKAAYEGVANRLEAEYRRIEALKAQGPQAIAPLPTGFQVVQ